MIKNSIRKFYLFFICVLTVVATVIFVPVAQADSALTLEEALAFAYEANPNLNAQRASVRATNEDVPSALSGYRPTINGSATYGYTTTRTETESLVNGLPTNSVNRSESDPSTLGLSLNQTLFDGFRTQNSVKGAKFGVLAAREQLLSTEQSVLLSGVTAYMNVLRDAAIVKLRQQNVGVLDEQLRATRDRFNVGEVTRTDTAQAEASLSLARSDLATARANLNTSRAVFKRDIGMEPERLRTGRPADSLIAYNDLGSALQYAEVQHPSVQAAIFTLDLAEMRVKIAEGALYPSLGLEGNVSQSYNSSETTKSSLSASVLGRLTVPIYQGGSEYSAIRQNKELANQARIQVDAARDLVRAQLIQAWGNLDAAKVRIQAAQAQVSSTEIALDGVREEARVGQRTTLDVLNAQRDLVNSRVSLISAQRDRVVASYAVLSALGMLTAEKLQLQVTRYDPRVHYNQVRDRWIGVRTPNGD